ncbi:unnamed protein product [Adineta steineri]|uniref:Ubiquitin-like protease family profile domain-containing protein n=2 Tax=Adineta steineri TaxID=433720 RepID=A0A815FJ95_9BILA|nr:unnamed protein product [Adineta steineri]
MEQKRTINRVHQSGGFDLISSPTIVGKSEVRQTTSTVTNPLFRFASPVLQRRRIDEPVVKSTKTYDTLHFDQQEFCTSYRRRRIRKEANLLNKNRNKVTNNQLKNGSTQKSIGITPPKFKSIISSTTMTHPTKGRGRPTKRPIAAEKLVKTFNTLTKSQIDALETTTWSTKSSYSTPTVWSIMCAKLTLKDNEKNKKWLAHIWQTNMWNVAAEVRKASTVESNTVKNLTSVFEIQSQIEEICLNTPISITNDGTQEDNNMETSELEDIEPNPDKWNLFPSINNTTTYEYSAMKESEEQQEHINVKGDKKCVHNIAERGATSLPIEHRELIDMLLDRPSVSGRYEADVPSDPVILEIDKLDLCHFKRLLEESKIKKDKTSSKKESAKSRDMEWINLFEKYVSQINSSCVFMYTYHHFSTAKSTKSSSEKQFTMSANAACKHSKCTCSYHAEVHSNGEITFEFKGKICHSPSEQRSRPYRGSNRRAIAEKLNFGLSPDQVRLKQLGLLSENNRKFGNFNLAGSSPDVFRKIHSESKTSLMLDKDLPTSLEKVKEKLAKDVHPGKNIPGYLQTISIDPLRLTLFTVAGLCLWKLVGSKVPVSWDATGGIVMSRGKRIFYYELTIGNIANRSVTRKKLSGPSFPVTSMLSTAHTTMDLVQWLQDFEKGYRKLYGFDAPFPKPPIVHSDGALVFQMAALRFFNSDTTLSIYLKRCWTIINKTATNEDLTKTIIHSCLSHFVKSVKRQALKEYTKKKIIPFALWIISLLVNSNTVEEMSGIWEHICTVLLSPTQNASYSVSISCLSNAADNINKDPNKNNFVIKNVNVDSVGVCQYPTTFDQNIDETELDDDIENTISEQHALEESDSPFRDYFTKIYNDKVEDCGSFTGADSNKYMENPYYNPAYLKRMLTLYLSTAPIWSNLMMGNLARYGYRDLEPIEHCGCHNSRTTGISESRMKVVKNTVLGGEVSSRIDQVVQKLGSNIRQTELNYSSHYVLNLTRNQSKRAKKILAEESWNKRGLPPPTTTSIYSEKPKVSLVAQLKKVLKRKSNADELNTGIYKNSFQSKPYPMPSEHRLCWLNSSIQLILSNDLFVEAISTSTFFKLPAYNTPTNQILNVSNTQQDDDDLFRFHTKLEKNTINFICHVIKSLTTKPVGIFDMHKYIQDLRTDGPKSYIVSKNEYIPVIRPMGELTCIKDYMSQILLDTIAYFTDAQTVCHHLISCSRCHSKNIITTERFLLLPLLINDCEALLLPKIALKKYFLTENNNNSQPCDSCDATSEQKRFRKQIEQLPDTLFISFSERKDIITSNNHTKSTEFFIQNHLDMSMFASQEMVCFPSYLKYQLKSVVISTDDKENNRHYYTFAKYGEQFYRCDDKLIELVDKSVVFERKYSISIAMYMREKNNHVNFAETIRQILSETENINLCDLAYNTHIKMMFDAALEYVVGNTKLLSWCYGSVYKCLQCKEENHLFGSDCILFSSDEHISEKEEISLDDTLIQPRLTPKIQCKNQCEGYTFTKEARYSILAIPQFVFVTLTTNSIQNKTNTTTTNTYNTNIHEQIYIKCDLKQNSFTYNLYCFIVVTKDERTLLVKCMGNNQYSVYNTDTKGYESLANYQFDDFVAASAANIVLCYETKDTIDLNVTLTPTTLDISEWTIMPSFDFNSSAARFEKYTSSFNQPLKIGRYQLELTDVAELIKPTHELNDKQLNAHLYVTTTLSNDILLFDSILFTQYSHRGFRKISEILDNQWFKFNTVLVPVHHINHWLLYIIDVTNQTILRFDSLPSTSTPYEKYEKTIIQLIRTHYFYTHNKKFNISKWKFVSHADVNKQDDKTSCGIRCGLFARSYVTRTQHEKIKKTNIRNYRMQFALQLLDYKKQ